jgi:hypothetical protein
MKEYIAIHIGNLTIELQNEVVKVNDTIVELFVLEYKILSLLSRADINCWISIEDIKEKLDHANISICISNLQKKLSKHKSTVNIIESLTGEYVKLGSYVLDYESACKIEITEFDKSSKETQKKEELIDELRYQIRRDMEDFKLLCSRIPDIDGEEYNRIFGDEECYSFFRTYLMNKIEDNIEKLRGLVDVR